MRYQRDRPGELVHIDVKKIAGIPDGGGWEIHGRGNAPTTPRSSTGYRFIHSALDDRTRLVYSEIHTNEQAVTVVAFWAPAHAWFNLHGITVERVLTDNGSCYRSHLWRDTLLEAGITPKRTRPFRPQTNGRIESYDRILLEEWAYIRYGTPTTIVQPTTTTSCTSTIITEHTAHSAGQPRSPASRTTSTVKTTSSTSDRKVCQTPSGHLM